MNWADLAIRLIIVLTYIGCVGGFLAMVAGHLDG